MADRVNERQGVRYLASYGLEDQVPTLQVLGSLLQGVLADGPAAGMSVPDASRALKDATGLTFDPVELRACAENPALGISVTTNEPPFLLISSEARQTTLRRLEDASSSESAVLDEWAREVSSSPGTPHVEPSAIVEDLRLFYFHVVLAHGLETVTLAYGRREHALQFVDQLGSETWERIPERVPGYRAFCRRVFPDFFLQASGKRAALVAQMLDRTFELCRLNLAPADSKALVSSLSGLTVYLDTNVVFRLLGLHGPAAHLDVRRTLALAAEAKAVARVTSRTLSEFEGAARTAIREGRRFVAPQALLGLRAESDDKAFFTGYHQLLGSSTLSQDDLLSSVRHVERTLEAFGVKVWTEKVASVEAQTDEVAKIARELHDLYEDVQATRAPEKRRAVPWETAEHDAFHLQLIQLLRDPRTTSFGRSKYWFLTYHRVLARKALAMAGNRVPCTMMVEQFHQLLRSVLPRSGAFDETFVRNLHSPLFQIHRGNYTSAMEQVVARLVQYRALASEHFANIVSDTALVSRVVHALNQPGPRAEKAVDALIESRLNTELQIERETRLRATRRAQEESQRASAAVAAAKADAERRAAAEQRATELEEQLSTTTARLQQVEAEVTAERRASQSAKQRTRMILAVGVRGVGALLCVTAIGWLWAIRRGEIAFQGTRLHPLALTLGLLGGAAVSMFPSRKTAIGAVVTFVLSVLGVSSGSPTSAETTSTTSK